MALGSPLCLAVCKLVYSRGLLPSTATRTWHVWTGREPYSSDVGDEKYCLHPEFIPTPSPGRINVWYVPGPAKQGAEKSERRDPHERLQRESPAHIVKYAPVRSPEGYEGVAVELPFSPFGVRKWYLSYV